MNNAEQLYYLRPVQWVKVVKSIGTLAIMVFQGKVQWLQRHTISKVICSDRLLASTWSRNRAVMQLLLHRHLVLLLKMLTSTCPANHKEPEKDLHSFCPQLCLSPSVQWQGSQKITRHLISTSLPIQLSTPWHVDHLLRQPIRLTNELISLVTLLDRGSIAIVHQSLTSEFLFSLGFLRQHPLLISLSFSFFLSC